MFTLNLFFLGSLRLSKCECMGWAQCAVVGNNEDSPKLQMPTAAEQALACIGIPMRLGVKGW